MEHAVGRHLRRRRDPLLRHVDAADLPAVYWMLAPEDRRRRLRLYLIAEAAQGPHYPLLLAHIAFDFSPEGEAYAREVVDRHDDAAIESMVAEARARWEAFDRVRGLRRAARSP